MADEVTRYLESYQTLEREAERLRQRLEDNRDKLRRITAIYGDRPRGGGEDRNDKLARLADMETALAEAYLDASLRATEIEQLIEATDPGPENVYRLVLTLRFLDGRDWDAVQYELHAAGIDCERRTLYNWYGRALNAVREAYDKRNTEREGQNCPDYTPEENDK